MTVPSARVTVTDEGAARRRERRDGIGVAPAAPLSVVVAGPHADDVRLAVVRPGNGDAEFAECNYRPDKAAAVQLCILSEE